MATLSNLESSLSTPGASTSTGTSTAPTVATVSHLSYPSASAKAREKSPSPPPPQPARDVVKNRLYVGNLHPTVDEYTFLRVFSRFGKVAKLDFLFHRAGPSKGKPRGYAFVEYKEKEDALKALVNAHDKLLRGRKLVVTYANQAPASEFVASGPGKHHRRGEQQRPTALSLIKATSQHGKTEDKIAALEAKLRQMERAAQQAAAPPVSTLPVHPSLPLKPPPEQEPPPNFISTNSTKPNPDSTVPNPAPSTNIMNMTSASKPPPRNANPTHSNNTNSRGGFSGGGMRDSASGRGKGPGKKPTLEELMRSNKVGAPGGLLKR